MADNDGCVFGKIQRLAESSDASLAVAGGPISLPKPIPYQFMLNSGVAPNVHECVPIDSGADGRAVTCSEALALDDVCQAVEKLADLCHISLTATFLEKFAKQNGLRDASFANVR